VADLLDGARWRELYPKSLVLLGLVPESLELGVLRSVSVEAHLAELVEHIVEEARVLGFPFQPRAGDAPAARPLGGDGAPALGL
jgi:hypothetical protein